MAEKKNYAVSIALSKLTHVRMKKQGKNGMVEGVFIPIEANQLVSTERGVYINATAFFNEEEDDYGNIGSIKQNSCKKWSDMTDEEKEAQKKLPYIGNFKDWSGSRGYDNSGAVTNEVIEEDEDLPF